MQEIIEDDDELWPCRFKRQVKNRHVVAAFRDAHTYPQSGAGGVECSRRKPEVVNGGVDMILSLRRDLADGGVFTVRSIGVSCHNGQARPCDIAR